MRFISTLRLSLVIGLTFLLASCSKPQLPILSPNDTIVAFGDSLTFGVGSREGETYPEILSELTGLSVINAGISGETTSGGLKRFEKVLDEYKPELVILMEGGNDILRNQNSLRSKQNLAEMIQIAQSKNVAVILIGVPEKKLFSDSAPFYSELADEHQLVFDDEILSTLLRTAKYKSDPIHLNNAGYRKFAERIQQMLIEHGAIY